MEQSDSVVIALAVLGFLTTSLTAVLAAVVAIMTRQKVVEVAKQVGVTHDLVNGMSHELAAAKTGQDRAEGFTEGEAAERNRTVTPDV